jgi:hypothetical protein
LDTTSHDLDTFPSCNSLTFDIQKQKTMSNIKKIKLGNQGLVVPQIGLGCMGMTSIAGMDIYGKANEAESIATIHRSLELGGNIKPTSHHCNTGILLINPFNNIKKRGHQTIASFLIYNSITLLHYMLIE